MPHVDKKLEKKVKAVLAIAGFILLAVAFAVLVLIVLLDVTDYGISIASFAATLFMIFRKPKSESVSYKALYGAYLIAAISSIAALHLVNESHVSSALGILIAFVLMTILDMQHAPAVGMCVALILNEFPWYKITAVIAGVFILIYIAKTLYIVLSDPKKIIKFVDVEDRSIKFKFRQKKRAEFIMVK